MPLGFFASGHPNALGGMPRLLGFFVKELRALAIAFHLRQIAHIVQGEGISGVELVGLLKILAGGLRLVAVQRRDAAKIKHGHLESAVFLLAPLELADIASVVGSNIADRLTAPTGVGGDHDGQVGMLIGGLQVISQSRLVLAFFFLGVSQVIQSERIGAIERQRAGKDHVCLRRAIFQQQGERLYVQPVDIHIFLVGVAGDLRQSLALGVVGAGGIHHCV